MTTRILRTPSNQPGWRRAVVAAAALAALSAPLAGCGVNRTKIEAENSSDSRLRHPIALVEQAYTANAKVIQTIGQMIDTLLGM